LLTRLDPQNVLYLTINLPDIDESSLKYTLEPTKIAFEATSGKCVAHRLCFLCPTAY
jgi:hypothetical protein